jgi:hypothetical protein
MERFKGASHNHAGVEQIIKLRIQTGIWNSACLHTISVFNLTSHRRDEVMMTNDETPVQQYIVERYNTHMEYKRMIERRFRV